MHFVTQSRAQQQQQHSTKQQQQQQQHLNSTPSSSSSSSSGGISPATRFVALCKSSSQGALPKSLATAQNYFGSFRQSSSSSSSQQQQQQRHKRTASLNTTSMIKDIDIATTTTTTTTSPTTTTLAEAEIAIATTTTIITTTTTSFAESSVNAMICDDKQQHQQQQQQNEFKEEEEKVQSVGNRERRDSITDELSTSSTLSTSKLLTIQELSPLEPNASQFTTSSIATQNASPSNNSNTNNSTQSLKTQRFEGTPALGSTSLAPATSITSSSTSLQSTGPTINISNTEEDQSQQHQQHQQQQQSQQSHSADSNGFGSQSLIANNSSTDSPSSRKSSISSKGKPTKAAAPPAPIATKRQLSSSSSTRDEDAQSNKISEATSTDSTSQVVLRSTSTNQIDSTQLVTSTTSSSTSNEKPAKSTSRLSERAKKKSWYNVIYPNYKSRAEDFKKLFKEVPNDERLIVDYSCALQRDILVQGRLYVSQNYVCFHANIFSWETYVSIKWKDVTAITKEKTALVIPNAISIATANEKFFFATFTSRDKSFLMLFRVWQNTLMNKQFSPQEIWKYVHNCYGEELGLTTDDEDYIDPEAADTDVDFQTAIEDSSEQNSNQPQQSQLQQLQQQSGNSSASSGGSSTVRKSKKYFFNSSKSSNLNSSANASASGSDNKASDTTRKSNKKMKASAKELTLSSVKPSEQIVAVTVSNSGNTSASKSSTTTHTNSSSSGSNAPTKESKSKGAEKAISSSVAASSAPTTAANSDNKRKQSKTSRQRDADNKNNEAAPTDVSDSSDSEENNIPFVATTECTSTHEGRQIVHTILPINVDTLFTFLFSKSKFITDFHALRKSTDLTLGEWTTNEEGLKVRQVMVTVQLAASVGPKASRVTEYQTQRECSKPGELYSIDVNSVNAGIPYADSFSVLLHFCLARTVDDHTMLSVHAQIKYKKSVWGVVKGFIEKNTWAGLEDFFGAQLHALQSETCIPPAKSKGRRPRRGTATQIRPLEEATGGAAQTKPDILESQILSTKVAAVAGGAGGLHPGAAGHHLPHQMTAAQKQQLAAGGLMPLTATDGHEGQNKFKHKGLSLFVILLMFLLLALNVILLLKLWNLEERIDVDLTRRARMPNLAALKELPTTNQDWLELLRQQELSHETELRKWHQVLQTAIELLKKTEKTLTEVMLR